MLLGQEVDPDQAVEEASQQAVAAVAPTMREMNAYFLDYIRSRRADPGSDLTSRLVQAEVDGERLADEEIIGFVGLLLLAGHITTTATLGNSVVCFDEHPDAVAEIRADPTLLPAAIEEVLRLRTPFPRVGRLTRLDTEVGGVPIPAGQILLPWLAAANRDERVFADPDRFDIHRVPNPHLTFGHGIHFCLGAPLARLEARVVLRMLLERFRDIEVDPGAQVEHRNPWTMVGGGPPPAPGAGGVTAATPSTPATPHRGARGPAASRSCVPRGCSRGRSHREPPRACYASPAGLYGARASAAARR